MTAEVEFWFEFASTYSYPAAMQVEEAAAARGVAVRWRPVLLGPVFVAQGLETSPFILNPVKGAYMWRDLTRICADADLPFRRPSAFPRGSLLAARIACRFAEAPWVGEFVRAVYTANFAHDAEIGEEDVIASLLRAVGQMPEDVIDAATTPEAKTALRNQTEHALSIGLFGAPTFVVGDELFWGHDRMVQALDWAAACEKAAEKSA